jgi:hypothetical protein
MNTTRPAVVLSEFKRVVGVATSVHGVGVCAPSADAALHAALHAATTRSREIQRGVISPEA